MAMAVAVKKNRETASPGLFTQLPVSILFGVVYVLLSVAILFPLLSALWWRWLGLGGNWQTWGAVGLVMGLGAVGLTALGLRLLGPQPRPGLRAGIAVGVLGVVLIALVTLWLGGFIENWLYANSWFGASDPLAGMVLTGVVGVALLAVLVRF